MHGSGWGGSGWVKRFKPEYQLGHPEIVHFYHQKNMFTGSMYPKKAFNLISKKASLIRMEWIGMG